jgi:hypothetical protein
MAKVTNILGRSVTVPTGVVKDGAHQTSQLQGARDEGAHC